MCRSPWHVWFELGGEAEEAAKTGEVSARFAARPWAAQPRSAYWRYTLVEMWSNRTPEYPPSHILHLQMQRSSRRACARERTWPWANGDVPHLICSPDDLRRLIFPDFGAGAFARLRRTPQADWEQ